MRVEGTRKGQATCECLLQQHNRTVYFSPSLICLRPSARVYPVRAQGDPWRWITRMRGPPPRGQALFRTKAPRPDRNMLAVLIFIRVFFKRNVVNGVVPPFPQGLRLSWTLSYPHDIARDENIEQFVTSKSCFRWWQIKS